MKPGSSQMEDILAELDGLYKEALEPYLMTTFEPGSLEAIQSKIDRINSGVCQAAGFRPEELTLRTDVSFDPVDAHVHLTICPSGLKAQAFQAARPLTLPKPPAQPVERLSWDGWPLGAPEGE